MAGQKIIPVRGMGQFFSLGRGVGRGRKMFFAGAGRGAGHKKILARGGAR